MPRSGAQTTRRFCFDALRQRARFPRTRPPPQPSTRARADDIMPLPQLHGHSTHPSSRVFLFQTSFSSHFILHFLTLTHPPTLLLFALIHPPPRLFGDCNIPRHPPPPPRASKNALQVTLCFTFLEHAPALFSLLPCNYLATSISSSSLLLLSADTSLLPPCYPSAPRTASTRTPLVTCGRDQTTVSKRVTCHRRRSHNATHPAHRIPLISSRHILYRIAHVRVGPGPYT